MPKPWFDLARYREVRLREALYEAELAEKFLEGGPAGNAAGKAFQSWKAIVAAYSVDKIEELGRAFPGRKKLGGTRRVVNKAVWIVAIMPTTALKKVAQIIGGDVDLYTNIALLLHEYQHNGPDPEGMLSVYPDDDAAARDVRKLVEKAKELARQLHSL